ncbi:MAG: YfhO family protein, partial [Nitrospinota bacterium]
LGWDSLKQNLEYRKNSGKWIIIGLLCLATLAAIAFGGLSYFDKQVKDFLIEKGIKYPEYNDVNINVFNTKRLLAIFMISALILYSGLRSVRARKILPYLLVSILTIDLFFAHSGYYFTTKAEEYHKNSESMDFILKDEGELFRVFTTPKTQKGEVVVSATEKNIQNETASLPDIGKEIIQGYNLERRVFDIDGIEVMRFADYEKIFLFLTAVPRIDSTNLLAFLNVKYVLSVPKIESNEFKLVKVIRTGLGKDQKKLEKEGFLKIYQNLKYLPRAFLVEKYMVITKEEDYKNIMKNKGFKPGEEALLYEEPWDEKRAEVRSQKSEVGNSELMIQNSKSEKKSAGRKREGEVAIVDYRNNTIKLNVNTDRPRILVLSETYYPGWKVYVNGQGKKILKANFAFRAIPLSAG